MTTAWSRASRPGRRWSRWDASPTACPPACCSSAAARPSSCASCRGRCAPPPAPATGPTCTRTGASADRALGGRLGGRARGLRRRRRRLGREPLRAHERVHGRARRDRRGNPGSSRAAYVAGLFDGPEAGIEDLTVIADWTHTEIEIEGRSFRPWDWDEVTHRRRLDLHTMVLERTLRCVDPDGRHLRLESRRLVSLARRHLGAIRLRLVLEEGPAGARARLRRGAHRRAAAAAAARRGRRRGPCRRRRSAAHAHPGRPGRGRCRPARSRPGSAEPRSPPSATVDEDGCGRWAEAELEPGDELEIDRFVAVYTERERPLPAVEAEREAREAAALGWDSVVAEHSDAWRVAWDRSDVEVEGAASGVQVGIRFAIAQLIAVAPTADGRARSPRRGSPAPATRATCSGTRTSS